MKITKYRMGFLILCTFILFWGWKHSHQDKPKNEIRILVDRAPNTLDASQAPDAWARKIIPLLHDFHYTVRQPARMEEFTLVPSDASQPELHFKAIRDEMARALVFMSGGGDVLFDSLSLSRTRWMKKNGTQVIEAQGYSLSFIGFQVNAPVLSNLKVRQAIALSFPVQDWIQYKFFQYVEAFAETPVQDLVRASKLLDEAGYPVQENGLRFTLHYVTTPVREGNEMALLVREALKKLGIVLEIMPLETSLFYQRLKRGDFEMFGSRLLRNSEADSVADLLGAHGQRNYFHYPRLEKKEFTWNEVKNQVLQDLPLIPLFVWKHAAVLSDRVLSNDSTSRQMDDTFRFLSTLSLRTVEH